MGSSVNHLLVAQPSPISENTAPIMRIGNLLEGKTCTTRLPLSSSRLPVLHVVGAKAPMVRVGEAEVGQCVGLGILQQLGRFGANAGNPPAGQVVELAHGGGGTFVGDGVQDREHGNRSPRLPSPQAPSACASMISLTNDSTMMRMSSRMLTIPSSNLGMSWLVVVCYSKLSICGHPSISNFSNSRF